MQVGWKACLLTKSLWGGLNEIVPSAPQDISAVYLPCTLKIQQKKDLVRFKLQAQVLTKLFFNLTLPNYSVKSQHSSSINFANLAESCSSGTIDNPMVTGDINLHLLFPISPSELGYNLRPSSSNRCGWHPDQVGKIASNRLPQTSPNSMSKGAAVVLLRVVIVWLLARSTTSIAG